MPVSVGPIAGVPVASERGRVMAFKCQALIIILAEKTKNN